ncbi:ABC transporter ATP-binding protein/permease [Candidatus Saccharibacteria bacterium]|nr:ABC transporter ATP-binding protein/permease [Candidatus Saccharibacteria bacterium]
MLKLNHITKVYQTGSFTQKALDSVSLVFPEQEFVSILGPSGSGKTTLLNIIGGLDQYTSGDLVIDDISTKDYKDADWDAYRNHRIGFVFQSYNLIAHQSILNNVRLALTLSGISKREGNRRAKAALTQVGLQEHINKHPAQLSGGQQQRVAIARALVNDPDILLADEPTGALDSDTSVQIMDLLKTIAKTKLVVMVTHNPDLAKKYSTRIIELKDGKIVKDSQISKKSTKTKKPKALDAVVPAVAPTDSAKATPRRRSRKTKMSFLTALGLSTNNLLTKKRRTILVSLAGSIGIIGIALIMAVSNGFQGYIDGIQEETLSSYPLRLTEESLSIANLMGPMMGDNSSIGGVDLEQIRRESGKPIAEMPVITNTVSSIATNDLKSFNQYYLNHQDELKDDILNVAYSYSVDPTIYTVDASGELAKLNPSNLFTSMFGGNNLMSSFSNYSSAYSQIDVDRATLDSQYEVVAGRWPERYDEMVLNLINRDAVADFIAYELGLKKTSDLSEYMTKLMAGESVKVNASSTAYSYEELMGVDLRLIIPSDLYRYNEKYNVYEDMSGDKEFLQDVYDTKSTRLKIVGIITTKEGVNATALNTGINYTPELIDFIVGEAAKSDVVKKQLAEPSLDVFSGNSFDSESQKLASSFEDMVTVDEAKLQSAFNINLDQATVQRTVTEEMFDIANSISADVTPAQTAFSEALDSFLDGVIDSIDSGTFKKSEVPEIVKNYLATYEPGQTITEIATEYSIPRDNLHSIFEGLLTSALEMYTDYYYKIYSALTDNLEHPEDIEIIADLADSTEEDPIAKTHPQIMRVLKVIFLNTPEMRAVQANFAQLLTEIKVKTDVMTKVGSLVSTVSETFARGFNIDPTAITSAFQLNFSEDELMRIVSAMMNNTKKTQKSNLITLGYQPKDTPTYISFYFQSFDGKTNFLKFLDHYNDTVSEAKKINYSDATGILMNSVKVIIDAVSYVLIAFVSISLVVSSIMIGVITYISVYERTKEIGILRAIGASKHNISSIFNAETVIIGLLAGLFGIVFSYLAIIPINALLNSLTGIASLRAVLPVTNAFWLVVLSVVLTLIGGLIPARAASKKDPVEALRTE